ncbi:hypothetical protein GIW05_00090 [Pseudomonas syringae]|uniref:hypothetical protein n=1 Tax=Pseudomonas syringae TaxID=317 RepID=UPI001F2ABD1E|nr:hypothetical protein [Pseudomonas syringae]MCF5381921.1 hypothetical protein [Pseudomonas syringae]MCF5423825.1 hypothetical protein [Pseudomonas syringae]MCF5454936.1 hypothetical protein [Pseudomonas syringae]MCF5459240.1 hypothetical protein [Pseudomonas syringae]
MKMSKQQMRVEMELSAKAAFGAVRQNFSGAGALGRTATFMKKVCGSFVYLVTGFIAIASWSVVGGLLIGPGHEDLLRSFHAWMIETPVDQVVAKGNALVSNNVAPILTSALLLAVMWRLGDVTQPAIAEAKLRYRAKVAEQSVDTPQMAANK